MIRDSGPPPAHPAISPELARALVDQQLPGLAHLEIGERFDGWDMVVYRLGEDLSLRLPRVEAAVGSLARESRLLSTVGAGWTFPHPRIVESGVGQDGYPWPWAVVSWLPGRAADAAPLDASSGAELGRAFAQVHSPAGDDAWFNPEQSITLTERAENLEWALRRLAGAEGPSAERLDLAAVGDVWDEALDAPAPRDVVWSHADPHGSNLLGVDGRFAGVIDWGKMAGCERAVDLSFLYTAMPAAGVDDAVAAYREATDCDDGGLERRMRGIAVAKCASWAVLDRPLNIAMAWRGFGELGVLV
ncbi:phosphotransferase [Demequina mangrovi]|uniref:Predicted kinase, aminoglycoside phosphotransferase (APT) family n=1 Tax=Demequina mangrovi TaxID=1043493 RepID=A0A1H7AQT1_9MICO|nr:phosphotransferase [Demequina mangrovi]SEJ63365.1 Predicted kinase, aminoglycoside phosphotransferase (APT) family [Demequina mangrovi]